jgi:diguanylate cyclase (GGDEF)-like protein
MVPYTDDTLHAEHVALKDRIAELERRLAESDALASENDRLRSVLAEASAGHDIAQATLLERENELAALHETALALMHHLDVEAALRTVLTRAAALGHTSHGFLYLVNDAEQVIEIRVATGAHLDGIGYRLRRGQGLSGRVWETGRPLLVHDYATWPGRMPRRSNNFHSIVAVPLISERGVIGVLGLSFDDPRRVPDDMTIDLLTRFAQLATLALDNARLYTATSRQARELELLGQVRAALARELDPPAVFRTVVEAIADVYGYTLVSLYLLNGDALQLQHQVGYDTVIEHVPISAGISGRVVRTRQPVLLADVRQDPTFLGAIDGIVSEVCVPLFEHDRVIGTLNVESTGGKALTDDDLRLMVALAEHVGIALSRARLYGEAQRQVKELEALRETLAEISANLDLDALLSAILERQVALLACDSGELSLYDPEQNDLLVVKSYNTGRDYAGLRIALGEGSMGRVAITRQPLIIPNYQEWPGRLDPYNQLGPMTTLSVPLLAGGVLVGVLAVGDSNLGRTFSDDDVRLLSLFAQQATVAIQNARLFEEVRQLAISDSLTGLYNRRHFFVLARREHERARRYSRKFAVLMLDVDDFKRINDTFGHSAGDRVLQAVGELCRTNLRLVDLAARYGGEEIVALLPDSDLDSARQAAERLRIELLGIGAVLPEAPLVTASIGVAVYDPADAVDLETLVERADLAQYLAKNSGKNQVVVWASSALSLDGSAARSSIKVR